MKKKAAAVVSADAKAAAKNHKIIIIPTTSGWFYFKGGLERRILAKRIWFSRLVRVHVLLQFRRGAGTVNFKQWAGETMSQDTEFRETTSTTTTATTANALNTMAKSGRDPYQPLPQPTMDWSHLLRVPNAHQLYFQGAAKCR